MKKNKNKQKLDNDNNLKIQNKLLIIVIVVIILLLVISLVYSIHSKVNQSNTLLSIKEVYETTIDAYGDDVTLTINNYMKENNGEIPVWREIEDDISTLGHKVSCENYINYDGSVYLSNCVVEGISYTSNYTYGKKLDNPTASANKLYFYRYQYSSGDINYSVSNSKYSEDNVYTLIGTYSCQMDNCLGHGLNPLDKEVIIYDGKYYVYNYEKKIKQEIDLGNEIYSGINYLYSYKKAYALSIRNSHGKIAIYNLDSNSFITNFIYDDIDNYGVDELLDNNYLVGYKYDENNKTNAYILNQKDGSVYKILPDVRNIYSITVGSKTIYTTTLAGEYYTYKLYDSNFELLIDDKYYYYAVNSDNTITVYTSENDKIYYKYDNQGKLILESKEYQEIVKVVKDYVIIKDSENNLKLIDTNELEITTFLKVTDEYTLHPLISGWYTENGKNGIYMVVENKNISYGTLGSGLEYYYIPSTNETGVIKTIGVGGYAKPVLYLYPTKKTNVTITFEKPYLLTTTYPKYDSIWNVTAYPNGDLYDKNNQYYYGLYWEETGSSNVDFSTGFYVTCANAISFLESKTKEIGFTSREANEFIMYWLPILEKNERSLVYFELTEERENYNKINISPVPDSLLRVAIHVKKVDKYTPIKEQNLTTFTRIGFTAVEWGGVEH